MTIENMSDKQRLVCVVMGDSCSRFLDMCFESVIESNKIVFCWGEEDMETLDKFNEWKIKYPDKFELISLKYDQNNSGQNGITRNFYLNYLKEHHPNDWCLVLDADEVLDTDGIKRIKEFIQNSEDGIYQVHMRHFHGDLGHEDSTFEKHWVINRLFKISEAYKYPEVEHPVLYPDIMKRDTFSGQTDCTTIWHLAHINHCFNIKNRYEKNMKHSNIHTPEYLDDWKDAHMLGTFPNKQINILEVPDVITNYFQINKDKYYFEKRVIELKHFIDASHWRDFFKCKTAYEFGCGRGPRVFAMNICGIDAFGYEISKWAKEHTFTDKIANFDLTNPSYFEPRDLVVCYDVLEHIQENKLEIAIQNLINASSKHILISVPVIGDPNLLNDNTHKIHKTKDEWLKLFTDKGLKQINTPEYFLYPSQIIILEKQNGK